MDIIFIEQLTVMAVIGVYEWERRCPQKLIFDLEIKWNNRLAISSDNVEYCLSYIDVTEAVFSFLNGKSFCLVETLAEEVANYLINKFKLSWIKIKVSKPMVIPQVANVGVIIERSRNRKQ